MFQILRGIAPVILNFAAIILIAVAVLMGNNAHLGSTETDQRAELDHILTSRSRTKLLTGISLGLAVFACIIELWHRVASR